MSLLKLATNLKISVDVITRYVLLECKLHFLDPFLRIYAFAIQNIVTQNIEIINERKFKQKLI